MPSDENAVTRRTLLASAAAIGSTGPALAQPREKGPLVWLDLDQQALDDSYDQAVYAPNRDIVLKRCVRNSELARERLGAPKRFAYGPTEIEALDVFTAKAPNAPVNVFVHGGAWRIGRARDYHYPAEMLLNAGASFVVLDFNNVGEVGGDLLVMADQVLHSVSETMRLQHQKFRMAVGDHKHKRLQIMCDGAGPIGIDGISPPNRIVPHPWTGNHACAR